MFVKEPKIGFVKTRLAKSLGDEFTLGLYKCFVKDLINTTKNKNYDFKLCAYPNLDLINRTFGKFDNFLQVDGNLGVKMQKAFEKQFELGYEKIVLIGSDTPHLSKELLSESFDRLEDLKDLNKNKIVIGPSEDGGYYLIGFNKSALKKEIFEDISWSTSEVFNQTLQKVNTNELYLLKYLNDIDDIDDLKTFYKEYEKTFTSSNTIQFLKVNFDEKV